MSEVKSIRVAKYNSRYSNKNLYRYSYLLGTHIKGESMAEVDAMRNLEKKYLYEGTYLLHLRTFKMGQNPIKKRFKVRSFHTCVKFDYKQIGRAHV